MGSFGCGEGGAEVEPGAKRFASGSRAPPIHRRKKTPAKKCGLAWANCTPNLSNSVRARAQIHHRARNLFSGGDMPHAQFLSFPNGLLQLQQRSVCIHDQCLGVFHEDRAIHPFAGKRAVGPTRVSSGYGVDWRPGLAEYSVCSWASIPSSMVVGMHEGNH